MARLIDDKLVGRVGALVFVVQDGKTYVRSRPTSAKKRKKTELSETSKELFTLTNKYGSTVIQKIRQELGLEIKLSHFNAVRSWIRKQLQKFYKLEDWPISLYTEGVCPIGEAPEMKQYFFYDITADFNEDQAVIQIPPFNPKRQVKSPGRCTKLIMRVSLVSSSFTPQNPRAQYAFAEVTIPCRSELVPSQELTINNPGKAGDMLFVVFSLRYVIFNAGREIIHTSPEWMPATIVGMGRMGDAQRGSPGPTQE